MPLPFAALGPAILAAFGSADAVTVTRRAAGSFNANTGFFTQGSATTFGLEATAQPSTPKEMLPLPENERTKEGITLFSKTMLFTSDSASGIEADVVTWLGKSYRVVRVEDWTAQAGYLRAIAVREGS